MLRSLKKITFDGYIRMGIDLLLVHLSILVAFGTFILIRLNQNDVSSARHAMAAFPAWYWLLFCPASLIFPAIYCASGLYTRVRSYPRRSKLMITAAAAGVAALVFLAISQIVFTGAVARDVLLAFPALSIALTTGVRAIKPSLLSHLGSPETSAATAHKPAGITLVVGGAGYIGSHLVRRLLENGHKVRVLDNLVYGYGAIKGILKHPNVELVVGDCRNMQTVVSAVRGVSTIIHLAAIVGDPACDLDKRSALEINYAATRMLTEVAKGHGVERFIFASSCSVYGAADTIMDETSEVRPISLYAQTKVDSENALLRAKSDTFHPTILRLATVFGNSYRPRFDLVVNLLTARAWQEGTITIFNGEQWRPFIHVRDIAEAIIAVADAPVRLVSGEVFNVGDSRLNYTLTQIAGIISRVFPATRVEHIENSDRRNYRVSFDKIRNRLGFRCSWDIEDGVLELKKAFEEGLIRDYKDPYYSNQKYLQTAGSPHHTDEIDERLMAAFARDKASYELALLAER